MAPDRRVRAKDVRVTTALLDGVRRSRTFAHLVAALERSDVIVYIELAPDLPTTTQGRLALVSKRRGHRYMRVQVQAFLGPDHIISIIGHELQHALEIARAPSVYDESTFRKFYERIGVGRTAMHEFDTEAARIAGDQVRLELRRAS